MYELACLDWKKNFVEARNVHRNANLHVSWLAVKVFEVNPCFINLQIWQRRIRCDKFLLHDVILFDKVHARPCLDNIADLVNLREHELLGNVAYQAKIYIPREAG